MGGIFISYRRQDSEDIVGRIRERLANTFGSGQVFKDTQSLPQGVNFRTVVAERIKEAKVASSLLVPPGQPSRTVDGADS